MKQFYLDVQGISPSEKIKKTIEFFTKNKAAKYQVNFIRRGEIGELATVSVKGAGEAMKIEILLELVSND